MAALGSQTIASSFEQLLHVDADGGGNTSTLVNVKDGDNGTTFCISMTDASTGKAVLAVDGSHASGTEVQIDNSATDGDAFLSFQLSGTSIFTMGVDDGDSDKLKIGTTAIGTSTMVTLDGDSVISLSTGDAGTSNTLLGKNTGDGITSGGNYNVCIGEEAGGALTTSVNNVAVGYNALYQGTTESDDNVAIGYNAMSGAIGTEQVNDCVAIGSGALAGALDSSDGADESSGSVAIGKASLAALITGAKNIAVGFNSGTALTTGDDNIAIGYGALDAANGAESDNIAIGSNALGDLDQDGALRNIAIGVGAGKEMGAFANVDNIAIGYNALGGDFGNTANHNIAIGSYAMDAVLNNSNYNVAIGENALGSLTDGADNNVAIGGYAGANALTPDQSVLVGYSAGESLTTGSYNTCIGYQAGNTLTTGSNNLCVGYDVDIGAASQNTVIAIGRSFNAPSEDNRFVVGNGTNTMHYDLGDGDITISSDERIKENIVDSSLGLTFIDKLRPVQFTKKAPADLPEEFWNLSNLEEDDPERTSTEAPTKVCNGLIAQEVKAVMDELDVEFTGWQEEQETTRQRLSYVTFVVPLIKAVQELSAKVTELENA